MAILDKDIVRVMRCPAPFCEAVPGKPCTKKGSNKQIPCKHPHPVRREAYFAAEDKVRGDYPKAPPTHVDVTEEVVERFQSEEELRHDRVIDSLAGGLYLAWKIFPTINPVEGETPDQMFRRFLRAIAETIDRGGFRLGHMDQR